MSLAIGDSATFFPGVSPSLVRLIQSQAIRRPGSIAIQAGPRQMDYSAFVSLANGFTAGLRAAGMRRNDVIAIAGERDPTTVALMLAVFQGGGACLPLDTSYPRSRLAGMLSDARPRFIVGSEKSQTQMSVDAPFVNREKLTSIRNLVGPQTGEVAYVLFTSGSTGQPKGVAMRTSVIARLIAWHAAHLRLGRAACTLQFAPLSFDVAFQEILSTLVTGGSLVLPTEFERKDPYSLLELIARERIERLFLPYVALQAMAEAIEAGGVFPATLRDVISAGEQLRITPAIRLLFSRLPNCRLHNHYGPTETHVVTALELSGEPKAWPELPSIGRPLPHVRTRIVGSDMNLLPLEVEGELLLGGDCLAAGYIHRPDLTEQRFIELDGLRWYRTGDVVAQTIDGNIEYLGRLDDQIKLNGFRVEPAEIEAALCDHSAVAEAAVVVVTGAQGKQLVAHVARRAGHALPTLAAQLMQHCETCLPAYLIPQRIVLHDALPLTSSGKIDRGSLKQSGETESVPLWPENEPIERQLTVLWTRLLRLPEIDPRTNLFELGARSLTVVQALAELRRHGFPKLTAAQIYEYPSIAGLCALLTAVPVTSGKTADREHFEPKRPALARFRPRTEIRP